MRRLALVCVLLLAVTGCSKDRRSPGPELFDDVDLKPVATVEVSEGGFDPATLTITEGDTFVVKNTGRENHTFSIEHPFVDTGEIEPGEETTIKLDTPGVDKAVDHRNDESHLTITVKADPDADN